MAASRKMAELGFAAFFAVAEQDESVQARDAKSKMGEHLKRHLSSYNDCVVSA